MSIQSTSLKSKIYVWFLYIGLVFIASAFACKYLFCNNIAYYILLFSGIFLKLVFLFFSLKSHAHSKFIYYTPLLLGIICISASMITKYMFEWYFISKILLYIAIPLKLIGVILLIVASRKKGTN